MRMLLKNKDQSCSFFVNIRQLSKQFSWQRESNKSMSVSIESFSLKMIDILMNYAWTGCIKLKTFEYFTSEITDAFFINIIYQIEAMKMRAISAVSVLEIHNSFPIVFHAFDLLSIKLLKYINIFLLYSCVYTKINMQLFIFYTQLYTCIIVLCHVKLCELLYNSNVSHFNLLSPPHCFHSIFSTTGDFRSIGEWMRLAVIPSAHKINLAILFTCKM